MKTTSCSNLAPSHCAFVTQYPATLASPSLFPGDRISCSSPEEILPLGVRVFYCFFCFVTTDKLTPCQEAYKKAIQNLKVGSYIPRCKDDGGFENVQCGGTSGQCWCVDKDGIEIPGTRTTKNLQCPDPGICCIINQTLLLKSIHLFFVLFWCHVRRTKRVTLDKLIVRGTTRNSTQTRGYRNWNISSLGDRQRGREAGYT